MCQRNHTNFTRPPPTTNPDSTIPFIPKTVIMKPILDVRRQTCLGSFETRVAIVTSVSWGQMWKYQPSIFKWLEEKEGGREKIYKTIRGWISTSVAAVFLLVWVCMCAHTDVLLLLVYEWCRGGIKIPFSHGKIRSGTPINKIYISAVSGGLFFLRACIARGGLMGKCVKMC